MSASRRAFYGWIWFAAVVLLAPPARAIVVGTGNPDGSPYDIPYTDLTFQGADQSVPLNLSGVVSIQAAGIGSCTGALLPDGTSILTAAHCVDGSPSITVYFLGGPSGFVSYQTSSYSIPSTYNGTATDGSDLAVINLGAMAPAFATSYQLDMEPATLGIADVLTGYGYSGTGMTGDDPADYPFGSLRAGENDFVEDGNLFDPSWSSGILIGQFYDPTDPATNVLGAASPFSASDEVDISFGDSGGPAFEDVNGTMVIVGVNDFIGCDGNTVNGQTDCYIPPSEYSSSVDSSYGQYFGDTSVYANLGFIETQMAPEPRTAYLMLGVLLASLMLRMRRFGPGEKWQSLRQRRALRRQNHS